MATQALTLALDPARGLPLLRPALDGNDKKGDLLALHVIDAAGGTLSQHTSFGGDVGCMELVGTGWLPNPRIGAAAEASSWCNQARVASVVHIHVCCCRRLSMQLGL